MCYLDSTTSQLQGFPHKLHWVNSAQSWPWSDCTDVKLTLVISDSKGTCYCGLTAKGWNFCTRQYLKMKTLIKLVTYFTHGLQFKFNRAMHHCYRNWPLPRIYENLFLNPYNLKQRSIQRQKQQQWTCLMYHAYNATIEICWQNMQRSWAFIR